MTIAEFSAVQSLAGGVLIGLGAVTLMAGLGRILGIAGILGGLVETPRGADTPWRLAFVVGLAAPAVVWGLLGRYHPVGNGLGLGWVMVAGLLVGFGTRMGNGCTSGHGICGLARLSPRSAAAVVVFMVACAATVYVVRHGMGN